MKHYWVLEKNTDPVKWVMANWNNTPTEYMLHVGDLEYHFAPIPDDVSLQQMFDSADIDYADYEFYLAPWSEAEGDGCIDGWEIFTADGDYIA